MYQDPVPALTDISTLAKKHRRQSWGRVMGGGLTDHPGGDSREGHVRRQRTQPPRVCSLPEKDRKVDKQSGGIFNA